MDDHERQSSESKDLSSRIKRYYYATLTDLRTINAHNVRTFRQQPWREISGAFGDMGTLLPLLIALTDQHSISLSSTLVFSGLANIFTGLFYGIPLPVQPMKAIAAVAIAQRFNPAEIQSAGLFVAAAVGFLSLTGLIRWFTSVIPLPVVRGIQLGTGLSLIISAGTQYTPLAENGWLLFLAFVGLLLTSTTFKKIPFALLLLAVGLIGEAIYQPFNVSNDWKPFGIWHPVAGVPDPQTFLKGLGDAGIGQLPLTTLNSVIAVTFLAGDLLPQVPTPSTTSIGLSVAIMNLVGCWFHAMPVCHGSGGLAAQYRFGARSGSSIIFLGLLKLLLGLFASGIAQAGFEAFSKTLLCIMLVAAGLELAKVGDNPDLATPSSSKSSDQQHHHLQSQEDSANEAQNSQTVMPALTTPPVQLLTKTIPSPRLSLNPNLRNSDPEIQQRRWAITFTTVAGILAFKNDAVGFVAGMLCYCNFLLQDWRERRKERRSEGRIRLLGGEDRERE